MSKKARTKGRRMKSLIRNPSPMAVSGAITTDTPRQHREAKNVPKNPSLSLMFVSQAAQQLNLLTSFANVMAASLTPSERVKYGWKDDVNSLTVIPNLIARLISIKISEPSGPTILAPYKLRICSFLNVKPLRG